VRVVRPSGTRRFYSVPYSCIGPRLFPRNAAISCALNQQHRATKGYREHSKSLANAPARCTCTGKRKHGYLDGHDRSLHMHEQEQAHKHGDLDVHDNDYTHVKPSAEPQLRAAASNQAPTHPSP